MASRFLLQIVDRKSGEVIRIPPGRELETELIEDCIKHIMAKRYVSLKTVDSSFVETCIQAIMARGVGLFKSELHVEQDIRDGLNEAIVSGGLEATVKQLEIVRAEDIETGIVEAITTLKKKVKG